MTKGEVQKLIVINKTIDGILTIREAAQALNLSERQIFRLKKGVKEQRESFVIHKNRGKTLEIIASLLKFIPEESVSLRPDYWSRLIAALFSGYHLWDN